MKTVILAGPDNLIFTAADLINPMQLKLIGYASSIEEAWNIYDENGQVIQNIEEMPIMPLAAALELEPDIVMTAAADEQGEEKIRFDLYRLNYRGEVMSINEIFSRFSIKSAAVRKLAWRLDELGVPGAAAELGRNLGDLSWQLNALMPDRKLYLFDLRDGDDKRLLGRMPYSDQIEIRRGRFPEPALDLEEERYSLVHINTDIYDVVYSGLQYFFPRMSKGGVILLSRYEDAVSMEVKRAVADLESDYGAFLLLPLADLDGTVMIVRP